MRGARQHFRLWIICGIVLLACVAGGAALVWLGQRTLASDQRALSAARKEQKSLQERLARVAQEAREMHGHLALWDRLNESGILGEERRLEWLDALARIRTAHGLHDLRYQIEPQKVWKSERADAGIEIRSSLMKVELALLHEEDLLRFLEDLRNSGGAYHSVRKCSVQRSAIVAQVAAAPSLRGKCEIDLITFAERKGST